MMLVWVLTLWAGTVPPFEAGQYVTERRCIKAAHYQSQEPRPGLPHRDMYGTSKLKWKCELKRV